MSQIEDRRWTIFGIITYVVLTFALSGIFYRTMIRRHSLGSELLVLGLMWSPGVSGLVTRLIFQRNVRGVGWGWGQWKYQWASCWIPLAYAAVVYLPLWAAGYFDMHGKGFLEITDHLHLTHLSPPLILITYILISATVGMIASCISALGEELGWRGFLVPELAKVTTYTRLSLISGTIWACWHVPPIIGADYHGAGPMWYSVGCFFVTVLGASFLFAWMRLKSGSVWTGMFLHASHNEFIQGVFGPLTRPARMTNYATGEFGAGVALVAIVLAVIFWRKRNELPSAQLTAITVSV